jgi:hypothetical protein
VVADALSRKASCHCLTMKTSDITLCQEMERLNLGMIQHGTFNHLKLESVLLQRIIDAQRNDEGMKHIHEKMEAGKANCFRKDDQGIVWFSNRIVVPKNDEIRQQILDEAHLSRYSIHPGSTKTNHDLNSIIGGPQFVAMFWEALHKSLGTKLLHSSAYHTQTSGQTERVNQILEDMLRACVLECPEKWDDCLPLAEFSYNNSYQEIIKMAPFEALYGRRCRTPLNWSEPGERWFFKLDMVKETEEKVQRIIHNLKEAQAHQKSYADKRRKPLYFQVEDYVYLKVSPMKGVSRFGVKGKLAPQYIGPFHVLEQCGPVAYRLQLP